MGRIRTPRPFTTRRPAPPDDLARELGAKSPAARDAVVALHEAVATAGHEPLERWRTLWGNASGHDLRQGGQALTSLARSYSTPRAGQEPDVLLFALHTYYAALVRMLVERIAGNGDLGEVDVADFFADDLFSWYSSVDSSVLKRMTNRLAAILSEYDVASLPDCLAAGDDPLGQLYQAVFPRPLRHKLGEYYTPGWLAEHVLTAAGYSGDTPSRLLDPACGSGTFLIHAIRRMRDARRHDGDDAELCRTILANVVGFDLNPLAVLTARANYLIAVGDLLPSAGRIEIPIHLCDSILDGPAPGNLSETIGRFDFVVGNPPWIAWDNLPDAYRRATKPLWERYGLFTLDGNQARHGGGKKDVSMLMLYSAADRYLDDGGRAAMVITQTLFQTKGAGDGFRRFRLGQQGEPLKVLRVDDMVALRPFQDAANWTATVVIEKGAATEYPVPYVKWSPGADDRNPTQQTLHAEPIDPSRPGSPWFLRPGGLTTPLARIVGPSDYVAYLGANSGGANGVYWVRILGRDRDGVRVRNLAGTGKRKVDAVEQVVEPDLLYPLLRWGDVGPYHARPPAHILLAQDPATRTGIDPAVMRRDYPRTLAYLKRFERLLTRRAAYRRYQGDRPFYSMYNVGPYTVSPVKVVWRRMDRRISAAVVETIDDPLLGPRPVIPQETCVLIDVESATEAHYVCAVMNSSLVTFLVGSHSVRGGKGFGTPSILDFINLRRFDPADARHTELASCSRQAHAATSSDASVHDLQHRIDELTGRLWGLKPSERSAIAVMV